MRLLTPFEKVLLDTGNANSIALCVLDRPPSLEAVLAELHSVCRRVPRMRSIVRRGVLWPSRQLAQVRLEDHVTVLAGEGTLRDLEHLVSAASGMTLPADRPPWRVVVVNPQTGSPGPHAIMLHYCHTIADGQRMNRMVCNLAARCEPADFAAVREIAPLIRRRALSSDRPAPASISFVRLSPAAGARLTPGSVVAAFATAMHRRAGLRPDARRRATALEVVADGTHRVGEEGNHLSFRAIEMSNVERPERTLAYRAIALTGPWRFGWGAVLPRFALRPLLAFWYDQFDLFLSFLPGARRPFALGGGEVREVWPVAPMLAEMPACVTVYQGLSGAFCTVQTGQAAAVSPERLAFLAAQELAQMQAPGARTHA